jgi:16S rRNA (guanine527-N7)-methyltransferase
MSGANRPHGTAAAIAALVARYGLAEGAQARLRTLLDLVVADPLAPTTLREPTAVLRDHLADSFVALDLPAVRAALALADLGSGAGFPGLPLAVALPAARIDLLESSRRKCEFIARATARCAIFNARVVPTRVEDWPEGRSNYDVVTARALAPLAVVAEYAAPLLRIGGSLVAWRGRREPEVEAAAARAGAILGLEVLEPLAVHPYPGAAHRHLHVMMKLTETPDRFPRRPGIARKRPLGVR